MQDPDQKECVMQSPAFVIKPMQDPDQFKTQTNATTKQMQVPLCQYIVPRAIPGDGETYSCQTRFQMRDIDNAIPGDDAT